MVSKAPPVAKVILALKGSPAQKVIVATPVAMAAMA
jgi:hypothetical protein